ncbi:MAG: hypothetical protein JO345_28885 [Streptosporangiaceae bacterium]|nr:hypothetical protein [Streptosporangiaceae bacterium]
MCPHQPRCPEAVASDRMAARVVAGYPEQGWSLLCNGIIVFDDTGALLPDGLGIVPPTVVPATAATPAALAA